MPEPTTVWFVRAGSVDASPGRISLEGGHLLFRPRAESGAAIRIPVASIEDVRRLRGSAVLQVKTTQEPTPLLFYFAEPPPLPGSTTRSVINPKRGMERTVAGMSLQAAARVHRPLIDEWVRAIRAAGS